MEGKKALMGFLVSRKKKGTLSLCFCLHLCL